MIPILIPDVIYKKLSKKTIEEINKACDGVLINTLNTPVSNCYVHGSSNVVILPIEVKDCDLIYDLQTRLHKRQHCRNVEKELVDLRKLKESLRNIKNHVGEL